MSFSEDVKAQRAAAKDFKDVDLLVNGNLYTFRFRAMDGLEWAAECDLHPSRPDAPLDRYYGYNLRTLTMAAAPKCGVRLDGDTEVELVVERQHPAMPPNRNLTDEWRDLFAGIDGVGFQHISDALFELNQLNPQQAVEDAKKALAASAHVLASRSRSGSRQSGSTGGSRKKSPTTSTTTPDGSRGL